MEVVEGFEQSDEVSLLLNLGANKLAAFVISEPNVLGGMSLALGLQLAWHLGGVQTTQAGVWRWVCVVDVKNSFQEISRRGRRF